MTAAMGAGKPRIGAEALGEVLLAYPELGSLGEIVRDGLSQNTAACLFRTARGTFFGKRYDPAKRDRAGLEAEHAVVNALLARDYPTPRLYANRAGATLTWVGGAPFALYDVARGEDRYRDASVFAPFQSLREAHSAGQWLASFHLALTDFPLPPAKPFRGITARYQWLLASSSAQGWAELRDAAPSLEPFLEAQPEFPALLAFMQERHARLAPFAAALPVGIIHGDFIKRNLFFEGDAVSAVLDFDLWNVGPWVYDLALALLPCGFDWGAIARGEPPRFADMRAFLEGYLAVRPLAESETEALPIVMESARVEIYLSLVAMALQQRDDEKAMLFWGFIVTLVTWFGVNGEWSTRLREGGAP
jgi:Ser/Thr protein kinase RdoA (MazF antagonist)